MVLAVTVMFAETPMNFFETPATITQTVLVQKFMSEWHDDHVDDGFCDCHNDHVGDGFKYLDVYSVNKPVHQMYHVITQSVVIIAIAVMYTAKIVQRAQMLRSVIPTLIDGIHMLTI